MNNETTPTAKEYYSLIELIDLNMTPLKKRALSTRFSKLLKNGTLIYGENLHRTGSSWQIHYTLIPMFNYHSLMKLQNQHLPCTIG